MREGRALCDPAGGKKGPRRDPRRRAYDQEVRRRPGEVGLRSERRHDAQDDERERRQGRQVRLPHHARRGLNPALIFVQQLINGLTTGTLFALISIGYTMVYGIIELINFAHGDLFMLGSFLALTVVTAMKLTASSGFPLVASIALTFLISMVFCASLNWTVDRLVY